MTMHSQAPLCQWSHRAVEPKSNAAAKRQKETVLEELKHRVCAANLARLASLTIEIEPYPKSLSPKMLEMHYLRGQASGSGNRHK